MGIFGGGKKKRRLEEAGVDAPAVLVSIKDTGMTVNDNPRVKLTFQVQAADGSGTFEVETKKTVSRVAIPQPGQTYGVRYDPEDPENFQILGQMESGGGGGGVDIEHASAGDVASLVQASGGQGVKTGSAAELLATGQRMTAVVKEFSPSGQTVGDQNPTAADPSDPVYVIKVDLQVEGASPIEALFMHRVPEAKVSELGLGKKLDVAVNPANPTREVAIDWAQSPVAA